MRIMALLALTATLAAQLPLEVMVDRYLLQAERAIEQEDFSAAPGSARPDQFDWTDGRFRTP